MPPFSCVYGLSPLARGTPPRTHEQTITDRFIPAGAGNTNSKWMSASYQSVYPRWRGEHEMAVLAAFDYGGLSPLARGTPLLYVVSGRWWRFIPAGAGNTGELARRYANPPVYPRWRGEHIPLTEISEKITGLSPLARGTPVNRCVAVHVVRFIPAGAGNTYNLFLHHCTSSVYPRWRGEHVFFIVA